MTLTQGLSIEGHRYAVTRPRRSNQSKRHQFAGKVDGFADTSKLRLERYAATNFIATEFMQ